MIKAALLLTATCLIGFAYADEDDLPKQAKASGSGPMVILDENKQGLAGLKMMVVSAAQQHAEFTAVGKVVSIQPLLALRERYLTAQAELEGAKAKRKLVSLSLSRQKALFKHGIAPKRSLQDHEAQGIAEQASVAAIEAKLTAIVNEARLNWGKPLAEMALSAKSAKLKEFIAGEKQLLQITLPGNRRLAIDQEFIQVEPSGNRSKAQVATFISHAALTDNAQQGASFFFQADATGASIGSKVTAWVRDDGNGRIGVVLPESSLVWYLDQVCVYIKTAKESFSRRTLQDFSPAVGGYFVSEGITAGEEIVITGGQMLLSEELKNQVPEED